ncbi:conserved membrane protein of unknown function [Tenacibaculum sp. 190130A14a]|uniref:Uncharacterized protein n=1 Tax=Tenacibaculum polynesiense TaxID=3137857 RepID=A0ABM9PE46_9FLAO
MNKQNHLYRGLFLGSVLLLLLNDLYLKYEFHNYLTGKLSDFVGLFAFPYFFSCFLPKRTKSIYVLTGLFFVFWKSEFSQPFFDFAHSYNIGINRTVDYSDLIALLILPISYIYWKQETSFSIFSKPIIKPLIIVISCFAFIATSIPHHFENIAIKSNISTQVKVDFQTVNKKLHIYGNSINEINNYSIKLPKKNATIHMTIKVTKIDKEITKITLDSIHSFIVEGNGFLFSNGINEDHVKYIRSLSKKEIEQLFLKQLTQRLKSK